MLCHLYRSELEPYLKKTLNIYYSNIFDADDFFSVIDIVGLFCMRVIPELEGANDATHQFFEATLRRGVPPLIENTTVCVAWVPPTQKNPPTCTYFFRFFFEGDDFLKKFQEK